MDKAAEAERSIIKRFRKPIWNRFIQGLRDYELIKNGDKVGVCISGGKDSMLLAKLIQHLQKYSDIKFEAEYIVMDPGYTERNLEKIKYNAEILGIDIKIFTTQIFESVVNIEKSPCYLCARMRRGYLYSFAKELGCNKIALGHHNDDVIETTLMGLIYGGQYQTMMPKLHSTNFEGMELIRPMYCVREADIIAWARYNGLEFLQCACRFTEMMAELDKSEQSKRLYTKNLIKTLEKDCPQVRENIFASLHAVNLQTVIGTKDNGVKKSFLDDYGKK